ncbi:MAG: ATP-binding protein [Chloroflexi bacterium]|nr:ATP-binding protein [Chloroflexota bacterium]
MQGPDVLHNGSARNARETPAARSDDLNAALYSSLLEMAEATFGATELGQQLSQTVEAVAQLEAVDGCAILLWDEACRELTSRYSSASGTLVASALAHLCLSIQDMPELAEGTSTTSFGGGIAMPLCLPMPAATPGKSNVDHFLLFPIRSGDKTFGFLCLKTPNKEVLTAGRSIRTINAIAKRVALAMENAHLYAENREQALRWKALSKIGAEISSELDLKAILDSVTERAVQLLNADACSLALLASDGLTLDVRSSCGFQTRESDNVILETGREALRQFSESGAGLIVEDWLHDPHHRDSVTPTVLEEGFVSFIGVPLEAQERCLGVLAAYSRAHRKFTAEDMELFKGLSAHAAVAIANAELYNSAIRQKEGLDVQMEALDSLLRSSSDGILVVDSAHHVVYLNPALEAISGWPAGEAQGKHCKEILGCHRENGASLCESACPLQRVFETNQSIPNFETQITTRWADERRMSSSYSLLRPYGDKDRAVVAILRDVTKLKDLEGLKADFLAIVSHELRTPLAAVRGAAASLMSRCDPTRSQDIDSVKIIQEQSERLESLIANILSMSKIDAEMLHLESRPANVGAVIRQVAQGWQLRSPQHQIDIYIPADLPLTNIDEHRMAQVFSNLLENACRCSLPGAAVIVQAEATRDQISLKVVDKGTGIPSRDIDRIFDKFYRVENSINRTTPGTGLGLSICKAIVEAHGGRIWAESELGKGTTLHIVLPTARAFICPPGWPSEPTRTTVKPYKPYSLTPAATRPRVLIVDDEPALLRLLRADLESGGFRVLDARTGTLAIQLAADKRPDAILVGLVLPDLDGLEVCRQIREFSDAPVIALSLKDTEDDRIRSLEVGADDCLSKPYSSPELILRLKSLLRRAKVVPANEKDGGRDAIVQGDLIVDQRGRRVLVRGEQVALTDLEYRLLHTLASNPNKTFTHTELLRKVWGPEYSDDTQYLWVHLHNLRKKIELDPAKPKHIINVHGVGYRFA